MQRVSMWLYRTVAEQDRRRASIRKAVDRPRRPLEDHYRAAEDGLITIAHLERHLPEELPFRGHTLRRDLVCPWYAENGARQYAAFYKCDLFFDCDPPARPWFAKVKLAERYGYRPDLVLWTTEALEVDRHEHLGGMMVVDRVPPERLPEALHEALRRMYEELEWHVHEEAELGCSTRPPQ